MITSLYIKDFALIDELETSFSSGLNIITGETGAGKSIVVGALNILLGERAQLESIRQGASKAIAEVIIKTGKNEDLTKILKDEDIESRDELILRREIRSSGSRAFVNDTPVSLSVLKQLGELLVDLHGQHDHQLLLKEENHRIVLDKRPNVKPHLAAWQQAFGKTEELRKTYSRLKKEASDFKEKQQLYTFQVNELKATGITENEEELIRDEMRLLDGAEILNQKTGQILELGREGEINALDLIRSVEQAMQDISRIEPEFESYFGEIESARISLQELFNFTEQYKSRISFDPIRLEHLRQRLTDLKKLSKKYLMDISELPDYLVELESKLKEADSFDIELEKLEKEIDDSLKQLIEAGLSLRRARIEEGEILSREIEQEIMSLGFKHAHFEVHVRPLIDKSGWIELEGERVACTQDGCDEVVFYISTNKGESPKALSRTASGGEISRIMLALKSILARQQQLPVMIFDEIDTGISGPVALQVGKTMRKLAQDCQIIAITHLPQIASMGNQHFVVEKQETESRTVTSIRRLDENQQVEEVAKLMSGSDITEAAIRNARELMSSD